MHDPVQNQKVQFFHSESSFGSSSVLSNSRVKDLAEQLLDDTEAIFINLRQTLVPREQIQNQGDIEHIIHRAKLLQRQTIPLHLNKLQSSSSSNTFQYVYQNRQKLQKLIEDYGKYKQGKISYQHFFDTYGRTMGNFKKNKQEYIEPINIRPDIVEVVETSHTKSLKGGNIMTVRESHPREKQVSDLKDQIHRLKKKQKQITKEKQNQIAMIKIQSEERVQAMLKMFKGKSQNEQIQRLHQTITSTQKKLHEEILEKQKYRKKCEQLQNQLEEMLRKKHMLQEETERNRKIQLQTSRLSQANSYLNFQAKSEHNMPHGNIIKLQKIISNLNEEKNLLRSQLNKERDALYRMKKNQKIDIDSELYKSRKTIQKKNFQINDLKKQLDQYKMESIKIKDIFDKTQKQLKKIDSVEKKPSGTEKKPQISKLVSDNTMLVSRYAIDMYKGQGVEGLSYYELLNREFKIRYRRSCLREKQLLHKFNGLEVGVISEFKAPNIIKIMTHLTDFGQEDIKNLSIKIINSSDNSITYNNQKLSILAAGQQIKIPIIIQVKNYPLGATVLVCQYEFYGKKQDFRLLLPAHIFKMMVIKGRDSQFREAIVERVKGQKKVLKDRNALQHYLKGCKVEDGILKCSLIHEQTQTKFLMDLTQKDGWIQIKYQHRAGDKRITDYFISTFKFLLQKDH